MRPAVALYEFMPYGAPDLIESRRRHMSRALWLTSTMALALYALTTGIAALMPAAPPKVPPTIIIDPQWWEPVAPSPPAPSVAPKVSKPPPIIANAPPLPVPDPLAPAIDPNPPGTDHPDVVGTSNPAAPIEVGTMTPGPEILPARNEWVYVEQTPVAIHEVKPIYPQIAIDAHVEGPVTVHVLVGKDGRVLKTELAEKFQVPMLNEAALAAARQWVFTPGMANGKPVACWTAIPFRFRLN
jgi:periplasmic protein TonB